MQKENFFLAKQYTRNQLELAPADVQARKRLIILLVKTDDFSEALLHTNLILKNRPDDTDALRLKSFILLKKGDYEQSFHSAKKGYVKEPDNIKILLCVGYVLMMKKANQRATKFLLKALNKKNNLPAYIMLVQNSLMAKDEQSAEYYATEVFHKYPIELIKKYLSLETSTGGLSWPIDKSLVIPFLTKQLSTLNLADSKS